MSSVTISIIAHNEGETLERCLGSAQWADEIIVVDCGSSDNTAQIARKYTRKVFRRPNNPNLNVNKTYGFSKASSEWIFYLDADELIPQALAQEIRTTLECWDGGVAGYYIKRKNYFFGRWLKHGGKYPDWQLRLFKKGKGQFPQQHVHERLQVNGKIGYLKEAFEHYPYNSITQLFKKFDFYTSFEAHYMQHQKIRVNAFNHVRFLCFLPWWRFIQRYFFKLGFLDGMPGFIACVFDGLNFLMRYLKLWELTNTYEYQSSKQTRLLS